MLMREVAGLNTQGEIYQGKVRALWFYIHLLSHTRKPRCSLHFVRGTLPTWGPASERQRHCLTWFNWHGNGQEPEAFHPMRCSQHTGPLCSQNRVWEGSLINGAAQNSGLAVRLWKRQWMTARKLQGAPVQFFPQRRLKAGPSQLLSCWSWTHLHVVIAQLPRLQSQTQPKLARKINLFTIPKCQRKGRLRERVANPNMFVGQAGTQMKGVIGEKPQNDGNRPRGHLVWKCSS